MFHFPFSLQATQGQARAGRLELRRGSVETPVFMPVGTQGAIRGLTPLHLSQTNTQIISVSKKGAGVHIIGSQW